MWSRPRGELNPWINVELSRLGKRLPDEAPEIAGVPPSVARLLAVAWAPTCSDRRRWVRGPVTIGPPWEIDGRWLRIGQAGPDPLRLDLESDPADPEVEWRTEPRFKGKLYLPFSDFLRDLVPDGPGVFTDLEAAYADPEAVVHLVLCESEAKWVGPISKLVNLEVLDISHTIIQHVEAEIRQCAKLRYFAASSSWLTYVPPLAGLPLEALVLSYLKCVGGVDAALQGLDRLFALDLHGTGVESPLCAWPELPSLRLLDLSYSKLERLPAPLPAHLRSLDLKCTRLQDLAPVAGLAQLEELDVESAATHVPLPDGVFALPALRVLRAGSLSVRDLPAALGLATGLEVLHIACTHRFNGTTKVPPGLFEMRRLQVLWLDQVPLTELPEAIGELGELRVLGLKECKLGKLPDVMEKLQHLEQLEWRQCNVRDLPEWLTRLPRLWRLDLRDNWLVKAADLDATLRLLAAMPALRSVDISYNKLKDPGKALALQRLAGIRTQV